MRTYRCLLFDLFSTVALWQPERMPKLEIDGHSRPSTLGVLGKLLSNHHPSVLMSDFYAAMTAVNNELMLEHQLGREIPSRERFRRCLLRLGLVDNQATLALAERLSAQHMNMLADATAIPAQHVQTLAALGDQHELALVSNFDHAQTAREILHRDGAAEHFLHIVISDAHGWRKPHPRIFLHTLELLGCQADEALFIGDSVSDDILGAQAAGIDVIWVNAAAAELPSGTPSPAGTVTDITELPAWLAA